MDVVRHEERLQVSTERVAIERVRVRRRIVTETRMVPVEVRREVLEIDRVAVPATEGSPDTQDWPVGPVEREFLVHEEVPVVSMRLRPVERVRVIVRTVTEERAVTAEVSTEQVDLSSTSE